MRVQEGRGMCLAGHCQTRRDQGAQWHCKHSESVLRWCSNQSSAHTLLRWAECHLVFVALPLQLCYPLPATRSTRSVNKCGVLRYPQLFVNTVFVRCARERRADGFTSFSPATSALSAASTSCSFCRHHTALLQQDEELEGSSCEHPTKYTACTRQRLVL